MTINGQAERVPFLPRAEVEQLAKDVLSKHGFSTIPVDPVLLARNLGMSVRNAKFAEDNLVGMIARRGDNVMILVNQEDPPYRKRFTIAHELGHHFLHLQQDGEFIDGEANLFRQPRESAESVEQRREVQANIFASALLMPAEAVRSAWEHSATSVEKMARHFNVSEEAMGYRLDQLGLLDAQEN